MCGFAPIFLVHIVLPSHKCNFSAIQTSGHRIIKPIISSRFIFSSYNPSISQASSNESEPHSSRHGIGNVGIASCLGSSYALVVTCLFSLLHIGVQLCHTPSTFKHGLYTLHRPKRSSKLPQSRHKVMVYTLLLRCHDIPFHIHDYTPLLSLIPLQQQ